MKKGNNHRLNKILRPSLPDVVRRDRLFKILDDQKPYSITWVAGAAGSGKSTLIADYLQKKNKPHIWYRLDDGDNDLSSFYHYMSQALRNVGTKKKNVPVPFLTTEYKTRAIEFSRRFFDYLAQSLKAPFSLVFDNYFEGSLDSLFQTSLKEGLLRLMPTVQAIIISRESPPNIFSDLQADIRLRVIGNKDLAFTEEETAAIIKKETGRDLSAEVIRQIFETTKGWAAGLRLILTGISNNKIMPDSIQKITFDNIFDYFDSELFQLLNPIIRALLVKSALWPRMPLTILKSFMKHIDIGSVLNQLAENHFFIEQYGKAVDAVYQYHPLFHEFLKSRVAEYLDQKEIQNIQIQAASAFEKFGWLEEALELYLQACRYEDYRRVILKNADTLVRQLRHKTLRKWLLMLPEQVRTADPRLNYWTAISYRFNSLIESRNYFKAAFEQFKKTDDLNGSLLAWSGVVDTTTYEFNRLAELDPYLDWFKRHVKKNHSFESKETEARVCGGLLRILYVREPENRDTDFWRNRALHSAAACDKIMVKVSTHIWSIIPLLFTCPDKRIPVLRNGLNKLTENHESRLIRLVNLWVNAYSFFMTDTSPTRAIEIASAGLDLAEQIHVSLYNGSFYVTGVIASLTMHDFQASDYFLRSLQGSLKPEQAYFTALFHFLKCIHHSNSAEHESAVNHGKMAVGIIKNTGYVLLEILAVLHLLQARFHLNPSKKIVKEVDQVIEWALRRKSPVIAYQGRLTKSYMLLGLGREAEGLEYLKKTLATGRKYGFRRLIWSWPYPIMEKLFTVALEHNLEPDFIRQWIRSYHLSPAAPENVFQNWNWPVQIETLGRFQVSIEGQKKNSCAKIKAKPWELLQLLIAFGPKPVAIDKIMDCLWPEKDGDLAHTSFKTTLNRLRNFLGMKEIILLNDNKVSINHKICFIDLELFERTIQRAYRESGPERQVWLEKAVGLYWGSFLAGEPGKIWAAAKREEVKDKFLSAIMELGIQYERAHQAERAIAIYKQGLQKEPAEEILYQPLMRIFAKRGQKAEVLKWYQRCRTELKKKYDVKPSFATQTIFSRFV
jgi:DNA-binding SARP family transcriptional activator